MTDDEKNVDWFARGNGIRRMGPYASQAAAWAALRGLDGDPIPGATVWPEPKHQDTKDVT